MVKAEHVKKLQTDYLDKYEDAHAEIYKVSQLDETSAVSTTYLS